MEERNSSRSEAQDQGKAEQDEEVKTAAHILCLIHKSKVDPKSAEELKELVAKHTSIHNRLHAESSLSNASSSTGATMESQNNNSTNTTISTHSPLEHLRGLIGKCSKPFSRTLTASDVRDHYGRLIIAPPNYKEFVMPLLTEEDSIEEGIQVTTYDERGNEYSMMLKKWCQKYYVLTTKGWKQFCHDHNLVSHDTHKDVLTLWMFRHLDTHSLCCAITKG